MDSAIKQELDEFVAKRSAELVKWSLILK
jgi:hypothetical protein